MIVDEDFNGSLGRHQSETDTLHRIDRGLENALVGISGVCSSRSRDLFHVEIEIVFPASPVLSIISDEGRPATTLALTTLIVTVLDSVVIWA